MTNKINEDLFLISEELSKEDKIYRENYSSINTFLNNQYNQAIFGTNKIEISISDNSPANRGFYMRYAKILDMVQNANGHNEELTNARNRLLLVLGNNSEPLQEFYAFESAFQKALQYSFTFQDLKPFFQIARIFLLDILQGNVSNNLVRRLIFISIYYDLSKDYHLDEIIRQYQDTTLGAQVKECLAHHNYALFMPTSSAPKLKYPNS